MKISELNFSTWFDKQECCWVADASEDYTLEPFSKAIGDSPDEAVQSCVVAEFHWPPELTPKIIKFVDRIKPARQAQKIKTHELLQIRLFEQWKRWNDAGRP